MIINRNVDDVDPHYENHMEQAHFCLAVTGAGWGVRLKLAVLHGCIPVVIADDVQVRVAPNQEPLQIVSAWQLLAWQVCAASKPCASSSSCTRPLGTMT